MNSVHPINGSRPGNVKTTFSQPGNLATSRLFKITILLIGLICLALAGKSQALQLPFHIDTLPSAALGTNRIIKVYLPDEFNPPKKYPVIYVLDESWMFEPTVAEVKKLSSFDVMPASIVVGINSPNRSSDLGFDFQTGDLTTSGTNFLTYLTQEVPQFISKKYSPPVFSILVGHSDGASFAHKAFTSKPDAFHAVVCLSQNLFGEQLAEYIQLTAQPFVKTKYYYVASGTRDATSRIESGNKLDSLFRLNKDLHLKTRQQVFEADHSGVAGIGLGNGLSFVFSDYYQPNDWDEKFLDSLRKANVDPVTLIESTVKSISTNYGVDAIPLEAGVLSTAFAIVANKEQAKRYIDYRLALKKEGPEFNSSIAQLYEKIKEYDLALEYWIKYLNDPDSYKETFFYFRRPIELLAYKMNQPKRAIAFAEEWEAKAPAEVKLSFKFFVAKIALDKNTEIKKGKAAIRSFIKNYQPDETRYKLEDAKKLEQDLAAKK